MNISEGIESRHTMGRRGVSLLYFEIHRQYYNYYKHDEAVDQRKLAVPIHIRASLAPRHHQELHRAAAKSEVRVPDSGEVHKKQLQ